MCEDNKKSQRAMIGGCEIMVEQNYAKLFKFFPHILKVRFFFIWIAFCAILNNCNSCVLVEGYIYLFFIIFNSATVRSGYRGGGSYFGLGQKTQQEVCQKEVERRADQKLRESSWMAAWGWRRIRRRIFWRGN